jgi:hypothetical protein
MAACSHLFRHDDAVQVTAVETGDDSVTLFVFRGVAEYCLSSQDTDLEALFPK